MGIGVKGSGMEIAEHTAVRAAKNAQNNK